MFELARDVAIAIDRLTGLFFILKSNVTYPFLMQHDIVAQLS